MRVIKIGPVRIGIRKRQEPPREWAEMNAAIDALGVTIRRQPEVRWIERLLRRVVEWVC